MISYWPLQRQNIDQLEPWGWLGWAHLARYRREMVKHAAKDTWRNLVIWVYSGQVSPCVLDGPRDYLDFDQWLLTCQPLEVAALD